MKLQKSALNALILSALIALAALALTLLGTGLKFNFGAEATINYGAIWLAILPCAVTGFVFAWVRYGLPGAVALASATLHDLLLSLALCAILSLVFKLSSYLPALLIAGAAFTYMFSIPVIRDARQNVKSTANLNRNEAARLAVASTRKVKMIVVVVSVLVFAAFIISGNLAMVGNILPLITGLLAAALSSCLITPYVWAAVPAKRSRTR